MSGLTSAIFHATSSSPLEPMPEPLPPIRTLLTHLVDYAGLFPPAELDMPAAVAEYAAGRDGADGWALGRFIAPAGRLSELHQALMPRHPTPAGRWRVSVLLGTEVGADLQAIGRFTSAAAGGATVDAVELKAGTPALVRQAAGRLPRELETYVEIPIDRDPAALVGALAETGLRAKVRTGGVTADAFPSPDDLVRFLRACLEAEVPFKATAGLHHPLRSTYRLTYAPDSPTGTMYGYLNLFLAAAFLRGGATDADARLLLEETDAAAFRFDADGVGWHTLRVTTSDLARLRAESAIAFGSCSFREPIDDLTLLHLL